MHGGIPFMGIHLSDLVYLEETFGPDVLTDADEGDLVNFAKMRYGVCEGGSCWVYRLHTPTTD